jgi:hypothetical protein
MFSRLGAIILGAICLMDGAAAATPDPPGMIKVRITQRCKESFYPPIFANVRGHPELQNRPDYAWWNPALAKPMVYKDSRNAMVFYVESDGRHLAAIDPAGKLLWVRNPFDDAKLCPYRNARPTISSVAAIVTTPDVTASIKRYGANPEHDFLKIQFNSSQFGVIDETTGEFFFGGQN